MKLNFFTFVIVLTVPIVLQTNTFALELGAPFKNGAIFQQNKPIIIWGKSIPGVAVKVKFLNDSVSGQCSNDSIWKFSIPAKNAGGPYSMQIKDHISSIDLNDLYIGEVWLASGQSNMELKLSEFPTLLSAEKATAQFPLIRQFTSSNAKNGWVSCSPLTVNNFSAEAYYFAKHLHLHKSNCAVGIILAARSGSHAVSWFPDSISMPVRDKVCQSFYDFWVQGGRISTFGGYSQNFTTHIRPVLGYSICGIIWDQGESGVNGTTTRNDSLTLDFCWSSMLCYWRQFWNVGEIPFIFFQSPKGGGWTKLTPLPNQPSSPVVKPEEGHSFEKYPFVLSMPQTALAVCNDLTYNLHPTDKDRYGYRLFIAAKQSVYNKTFTRYKGPKINKWYLEGNDIILIFDTENSLQVLGSSTIQGFSVAGIDKKFVWATAQIISGNKIRLRPGINISPYYISYGCHNSNYFNLFDSDSFPTFAFYKKIDSIAVKIVSKKLPNNLTTPLLNQKSERILITGKSLTYEKSAQNVICKTEKKSTLLKQYFNKR